MRVKMTLSISGTRDGKPWPAKGAVIDLPETEAHALMAMGAAEEVKEAPKVEAAVPDSSDEETAVAPTKPARKPRSPRKPS